MFYTESVDPNTVFLASSDNVYADYLNTRKSLQGYGFILLNGIIDFKASKQSTVTLSSTEAELIGVTYTTKETI